jgi:hypothetical protein
VNCADDALGFSFTQTNPIAVGSKPQARMSGICAPIESSGPVVQNHRSALRLTTSLTGKVAIVAIGWQV